MPLSLNRGEKLTEILKQKQYVPMVVEEQVCVLYAGVRGYLDKINPADIGVFEVEYLKHLRSKHQTLLSTIRVEQELTDRTDAEVASSINEFLAQSGLLKEE